MKESGIKEGDLIILHSSYGNLKPISLDNKGIIDRLLELVGPTGTLAAPVIRRFDEEKELSLKDKIRDKVTTIHCTYDVDYTPVSSGVLRSTLMQHENSVTSLFPLNPLTAVGPLARDMIKGNLDENFQSAHGPGSCWKFCADNNAIIVYLGVNYGHHITMQQVVTESYIYLMKSDLMLETIREIDGSCIYGCKFGDNFAFSTTVEPDGRHNSILNLLINKNRGAGIKDRYSHLYTGNLSDGFNEIYKEKKDIWPFLFQFGVIRFPYGDNPTDKLYFQPIATNQNDLDLMRVE